MNLGKTKEFHKFLIKLLSNDEIIKVGHSIKEDFTLSNFYFPQAFTFRNYFDLPRAYKYIHPEERKYGLSYLTQQAYPDKEMSKYEQTSNWLRRPLRKSQMHYAALDAFVCLKLFKIYEEHFVARNKLYQFGKILSDFQIKSEEEILKLEEAEKQNRLGAWRRQHRENQKRQEYFDKKQKQFQEKNEQQQNLQQSQKENLNDSSSKVEDQKSLNNNDDNNLKTQSIQQTLVEDLI